MNLPKNKKIYFASDQHFGAPTPKLSKEREQIFLKWLEKIEQDAAVLFLLGDLFDFWFEYKTVVPKGFVRILGKLASLVDQGIPVHYFVGNHDLWMKDYFQTELNIPVYFKPQEFTFNKTSFFIGHGDGLGPNDLSYKRMKKLFTNPFAKRLFQALHPDIGMRLGHYFSVKNKIISGDKDAVFLGEENECLALYAKRKLKEKHRDYFIFGHRHIPMQIELNQNSKYINLGDWISNYTYAEFDGNHLELKNGNLVDMIEEKSLSLENTVLIGVINSRQDESQSKEYMDELEFLTYTAGGKVLKRFTQKIDPPNPKTFIGSGKMVEVMEFVKQNDISSVIFDDELTPAQQGNIEKLLKVKILDRTGLILDIFAQRAQTSYARTQVELAQYQYLLPRLKGLWTHLERQKGGIGMRGPGETEIETDRRIVRDKISLLKKKLVTIDKQMATQRGNRGALVRVALVGYTNVGKSTLMNVIAKSDVFAENKLFATLDTTVRKVVIGNLPFLLSDTVGFIRKLPTQLVESFKSTLDEVQEADLLLHVVDISHPNFEEHIESVNQILKDINSLDKPTYMVFNKIDAYEAKPWDETELIEQRGKKHYSLQEWEQTWMNKMNGQALFISAINKGNINEFRTRVYDEVRKIHVTRFPYNHFLYPEILEEQ